MTALLAKAVALMPQNIHHASYQSREFSTVLA